MVTLPAQSKIYSHVESSVNTYRAAILTTVTVRKWLYMKTNFVNKGTATADGQEEP